MAENTKEKIAKIGIQLMKERGYDNVTINQICKQSDISKHTFYYHFDSKEAIIRHLVVVPFDTQPEDLVSLFNMDSPIQQYLSIIKPRVEHIEECGVEIVKKLLANKISFFPNHDKPHGKHPLLALEISLIQKAQEKNEISNRENPEDLARMCFIAMMGTAQVWSTSNGMFDLTKGYLSAVQTILGVYNKLYID